MRGHELEKEVRRGIKRKEREGKEEEGGEGEERREVKVREGCTWPRSWKLSVVAAGRSIHVFFRRDTDALDSAASTYKFFFRIDSKTREREKRKGEERSTSIAPLKLPNFRNSSLRVTALFMDVALSFAFGGLTTCVLIHALIWNKCQNKKRRRNEKKKIT